MNLDFLAIKRCPICYKQLIPIFVDRIPSWACVNNNLPMIDARYLSQAECRINKNVYVVTYKFKDILFKLWLGKFSIVRSHFDDVSNTYIASTDAVLLSELDALTSPTSVPTSYEEIISFHKKLDNFALFK